MRAAILTMALVGAAQAAPAQDYEQCRHEEVRSKTVDAASARRLIVEAGAGSLKIEGKPGLRHVVVRARACASSAALLRVNSSGNEQVW